MSTLESTLNNEIDEFIAQLQEARSNTGYQSKVWMISQVARQAGDWAFYWEEKLAKWSN